MIQDGKTLALEDRAYEDIQIGDPFSFRRFIGDEEVKQFAALTGDFNPLHTDPLYAKTSEFGESLVHGMLMGSLFSALIGMVCPGKRALYLSQTLAFRNPLPPNRWVIVSGTVSAKSDAIQVMELKTAVTAEDTKAVIVEGIARVRIRHS